MHKIKQKLMEELEKIEQKMSKSSGGALTAGDLEYICKLTEIVKNIDKIEMLEDGDYSEATDFMGEGRMYGTSYARGRGRNARRDSMGRYSREDGSSYEIGGFYNDMPERGGTSYARGNRGSRSVNSRSGGYSYGDAKEEMSEKLEELMEMAENEQERRAIQHCKRQIENA